MMLLFPFIFPIQFSFFPFMLCSLSVDDINLIKYTIIALPPGTSIAFIYINFVTRRLGRSLVPHTNATEVQSYIRKINNEVVRNTKRALNSFQHNPYGRSLYQPLPQEYNPYDYIVPKPGSEHICLPPFTHEHWKSQFEPTPFEQRNIMPPKKKTKAKQEEDSMFSPTKPSTVANQTTTDINANNSIVPVSPHRPAWLRPRFGSPIGSPVLQVDVDYHLLIMSFDENNLAFVGEGFNLWAALVNNGAEKDGVKSDVFLLVHVRPHPLDNGQPIQGMVPFLGSDNKTIFMLISIATEPTIFDSVKSTIMTDETKN